MPARLTIRSRLLVLLAAVVCARGVLAGPDSSAGALNEAARDRARAAACFATGKTLYERGDLAGALRSYQRAWQWDPSQLDLLDEIVSLAVSLERVDEAARYALLSAEHGGADPDMLRRLALYVTEQRQWPRAARLYRMWLDAAPDDEEEEVSRALVHLELGRLEYLSDNAAAASEAFANAQHGLLRDPESPTARRLRAALGGSLASTWETFGRCHLEAGRLELAAAAFEQLVANPGTEREGRGWAARLALAQQRPLDAYESVWKYFDGAGEPLGGMPYETLREALVRLNDPQRAQEDLERLRRERQMSCYAMLILARDHAVSGREAEADTLYESLVRRSTADKGAGEVGADALSEAGDWLIRRCARTGQPSRLLTLARLLARRSGSLGPFERALGDALSSEDFARQVVTRLKTGDTPTTATDALAEARLALLAGDVDLAGERMRAALASEPAAADRRATTWAVDLLLDEHYDRAASDLRWAIDQGVYEETAAAPWFYLGTALALGGRHDRALEAARRAAQLAPNSAEMAARPAWILQTAERTDEAIDAYREVIDRFDDDHDPATRAVLKNARMALSYLTLDAGDADASAEWLEQVLDEFPQDVGAKNDLGYLWANGGVHLRRARRMIEQAVEAAPENAAYLDSLGWVRYRQGDLRGALEAIQRAVAIESADGEEADAEILGHLGDVLHALGRHAQAADAWRRAAEQYELAGDERAAGLREKIESLRPAADPGR